MVLVIFFFLLLVINDSYSLKKNITTTDPRHLLVSHNRGKDDDNKRQVAVCVGGQVARWFPHQLRSGLIDANPQFNFHLFFNIQYPDSANETIYNTDQSTSFLTSYGKKSKEDINRVASALFHVWNSCAMDSCWIVEHVVCCTL